MAKIPHTIDTHVGRRIRMRRLALGMSQERVGEALGVSFQQVQKYEKGVNRVSASRLQRIADVLRVPVAHFFDGMAQSQYDPTIERDIASVLRMPEGARIARALARIRDPEMRRRVAALLEAIVEQDADHG